MTQFDVLAEVKRRTAVAILGQSGIAHEGLRAHLRAKLAGGDAADGALMQEPLIEGAHPFVTDEKTMAELAGSLLNPSLIAALDSLPPDHDYRFPKTRKPFRHQTEAWRALLAPDPRSVLVTSGTGSGKTECFLLPILSDLARQAAAAYEPLTGVQAIMLYPLNALIESQRERLSAWTQPFGGRVRYCLYNGDLPKQVKQSVRIASPERLVDRVQLRKDPPPILVTNVTMLEYMLVRAEDQPIIDASRGRLKWIVLDEAHSLVGAAAAEIALLLRRVMLAFAAKPEEVRFVATSATIGSGPDVRRQLQSFLADVAGIPEAQVLVVEGSRRLPARPTHAPHASPADLRSAQPAQLYDILGRDPKIWSLIERLFAGGVPLSAFGERARAYGVTADELVLAMARAARGTSDGEESLAPVRIHAFERAVPGVWSCVNPDCSGEHAPEWRFGRLLFERADECPNCKAPALEIVDCAECGEVYLEGVEAGGRLTAPLRNPPRDEFAFDSGGEAESAPAGEGGEDGEEAGETASPSSLSARRLFAENPTSIARPFWLDPRRGWRVADARLEDAPAFLCEEHRGTNACPHCAPQGRKVELLRPVRFGAPFILGAAAPILLEGVGPASAAPGEKLPSSGRRLLSFTDSRQGTARLSAKLQVEAERNFVRSFVYHQVQASMRPAGDQARSEQLELELEALRGNPHPLLQKRVSELERELAELTTGNTNGVPWSELADRLAERIEVSDWISEVWRERDPEQFSDASKVAQFLLLREFARRPRRANSVETLGLARLRNPAVEALVDVHLPDAFRRRGKTLDDWRGYLDAVLTWLVRANSAIAISRPLHHWISPKGGARSLVGPDAPTRGERALIGWPNGALRSNPRARAVALLVQGLKLDISNPPDREDLATCLRKAWDQIQHTFAPDPERRVFDFSKTFVAPLTNAFFCPVTRRILDRAPFGLSPYGLQEDREERKKAVPVVMPRHPSPLLGPVDLSASRLAVTEWLTEDSAIAELRRRGVWNDISDRVALFADYARSAEHSAQQDSGRLRRYEQAFKAGRINVLNCSTTMEMGVDIGSVSTVMMTNAPPSIANYRQRVGRAGRRGQAAALAFTFCKDRPLDREAFHDPQAFLKRTVAAPKVTLSSRPIVQRHVNAYLLGRFMREQAGDASRLHIGAFLGCPADPAKARPLKGERPVQMFAEWLTLPSTRASESVALASLVRRSALEGDGGLLEQARQAIQALSSSFVADWEGLLALAKDDVLEPGGQSRMKVELQRLCEEFLLGALADRGFLPGHGFPTDVVTFIPGREFKGPQDLPQDGRRQSRALGPQRSLDLAIRDYAPGSEVVLDGLVHTSAGVTLNWKRPATEENLAEIQSLKQFWRCSECGAADVERAAYVQHCTACGADALRPIDFLRPAGFSVDPRAKAHAETDRVSFVPAEEPQVSTRDAPWRRLPAPQLGRYRCSREGLVFYCNRGGPEGAGYAVCLQCGRAEADTSLHDGSAALVDHRPLRFRKGEDRCPGNDKPFSIRRRLSLGLEITTDVFELQPRHGLALPAAYALVIALREALAQELGVDADEIGFEVDESRNDLGAPAKSLLLFDRATGGAGFSVALEHRIESVLARTRRILDCSNPGCERACPACVLTSDAPDGKDALDRSAALNFVVHHLTLPPDLEPEDRFTPDARLSIAPIDEIGVELLRSAASSLTIFLPDLEPLGLATGWPIAQAAVHWNVSGHKIRLVAPEGSLARITPAERMALRDFALRNDVALAEANAPTLANGAHALASVRASDRKTMIWASRDPQASGPGPDWGRPGAAPIARGAAPLELTVVDVDLSTLLPPQGAKLVEVDRELDVPLSEFGDKAAELMARALENCGTWSEEGIARATYQDPYVSSPLVARLLLETLRSLLRRSGSTDAELTIETRPPRADPHARPSWLITHDWAEAPNQKGVVEALSERLGVRARLVHASVPHGRYLRLAFKDGRSGLVVLDQGFGAWALPQSVRVRHDFKASPAAQSQSMTAANAILQRRGVGRTYFVASPSRWLG
ncbi:DEAD/DEAH box helicase [Hansschlegelia beijingensis]